ncbi:hypothetical protein V8E54_013407 [Elaphomyces granulatus]
MEALDDDEFGERTATFQPVLNNIRVEKLPISASSVRQHLIENDEDDDCSITYPLLYGAEHMIFPLEFTDGLRWALKIPAAGHHDKFNEFAARALTSEALILQLLKRETTIPVPEVYSFDASFDNPINCPFILMEFIVGIPLGDCWFDKGASKALVAERRARTLQDLAAAMVQMNKFIYTLGGSPTFDEDGNLTGIGPWTQLTETDDPENPDKFSKELGPFTDQKSFLLCLLDGHEPPPPSNHFGRGMYNLLRLFIDWAPIYDQPEFVLSHPDFDMQNVIVSKEGELRGLIDWDGVVALPRCIANERYPNWLTRDWSPSIYCYGMDRFFENEIFEDSPQTLALYRSMYLDFMATCLASEEDIRLTRNSHIMLNLWFAAIDSFSTYGVVEKIFDEIVLLDDEALKSTDRDDFFLADITDALADGELDEFRLQWLERGFKTLCH